MAEEKPDASEAGWRKWLFEILVGATLILVTSAVTRWSTLGEEKKRRTTIHKKAILAGQYLSELNADPMSSVPSWLFFQATREQRWLAQYPEVRAYFKKASEWDKRFGQSQARASACLEDLDIKGGAEALVVKTGRPVPEIDMGLAGRRIATHYDEATRLVFETAWQLDTMSRDVARYLQSSSRSRGQNPEADKDEESRARETLYRQAVQLEKALKVLGIQAHLPGSPEGIALTEMGDRLAELRKSLQAKVGEGGTTDVEVVDVDGLVSREKGWGAPAYPYPKDFQ